MRHTTDRAGLIRSSANSRKPDQRASLAMLIGSFDAFLFLFTSSGRLNNWDPFAQLQAATALVTTGNLGVAQHPLPEVPDLWVRTAKGNYYQAHDLGGTLFLTPAAAIGAVLEGDERPAMLMVQQPPWPARVLGTLQYALLGAWGCFLIYQLFACLFSLRTAFLLSLIFAATTTYWAYTRIAYDILGGCVGVCLLLRYCTEALMRSYGDSRDPVRIGAAAAFACVFRFSLTPFLLVGIAGVMFVLRHRWDWRLKITAVGVLLIGLAPNFYYNFLRTEMPLKNAATGHAPVVAALHGTLRDGLYGLLLSPNWGLLWFAPIFALLLLVPWIWRKAPLPLRQLLICFVPPMVAYLCVIAKLNNWTGFSGWGPRYLLPFVPVLFLGVAMVLTVAWKRYGYLLVVVLLLSALVNLPSIFVNFRAARSAYPGGYDTAARSPRQHIAVWRALIDGVNGRSTPALADAVGDTIRSRSGDFPDLWTAQLIRRGGGEAVVGLGTAVMLLVGTAASLRQIIMNLGSFGNSID